MPRKSKSVCVEIVPRERNQETTELKLMIAQMIEQKVAEATSGSDAIFQPFFQSHEIANEIKRRQTVQEQNKWVYYFEKHGCLVCQRSDRHQSLGMCLVCYGRTKQRLTQCLRDHAPAPDPSQPTFMDTVRMAQAALAPSLPALAGRTAPEVDSATSTAPLGPHYRTQKEAAKEVGIDRGTLSDWIASGKVQRPATKLSAKKWLWTDEDVERLRKFVDETRKSRTSEGQ